MKYIWCCDICTCESRSVRQDETSASWAVVLVLAAVTVVLTSGPSLFQFMHHWSSAKNMTAAGVQFLLRVRLTTTQTFIKLFSSCYYNGKISG